MTSRTSNPPAHGNASGAGEVSGRERLLAAAIEYFAEHGIGDASLRAIATGIGSSHRMLIYHFGSRDGLLAEVVRVVESQQRETLARLTSDPDEPLLAQSTRFWNEVVEATRTYGPLFFELSAQAMQHKPHTAKLRADLIHVWLPPLTDLLIRAGIPSADAPTYARLSLATARGLLFDLLLTNDRAEIDQAHTLLNTLLLPPTSPTSARPPYPTS